MVCLWLWIQCSGTLVCVGSSVSIDKQDQKLQYVGMNLKCFINHKTLIYIIIQRVNFGYSKSTLLSSHIGVTPTHHGAHPHVREREYTPELFNKFL